jgi:hypothetical protein
MVVPFTNTLIVSFSIATIASSLATTLTTTLASGIFSSQLEGAADHTHVGHCTARDPYVWRPFQADQCCVHKQVQVTVDEVAQIVACGHAFGVRLSYVYRTLHGQFFCYLSLTLT